MSVTCRNSCSTWKTIQPVCYIQEVCVYKMGHESRLSWFVSWNGLWIIQENLLMVWLSCMSASLFIWRMVTNVYVKKTTYNHVLHRADSYQAQKKKIVICDCKAIFYRDKLLHVTITQKGYTICMKNSKHYKSIKTVFCIALKLTWYFAYTVWRILTHFPITLVFRKMFV